jgi:hypothetical protein
MGQEGDVRINPAGMIQPSSLSRVTLGAQTAQGGEDPVL